MHSKLTILFLSLFLVFSEASAQGVCVTTQATTAVRLEGGLPLAVLVDSVPIVPSGLSESFDTSVTFPDIAQSASAWIPILVYDTLGGSHSIILGFFRVDYLLYEVYAYALSDQVNTSATPSGYPRRVGQKVLEFDSQGARINSPSIGMPDLEMTPPWNNGSDPTGTIDLRLDLSLSGGLTSLTVDGNPPQVINNTLQSLVSEFADQEIVVSVNLSPFAAIGQSPSVPGPGNSSTAITFDDLLDAAAFNTSIDVSDSSGAQHQLHLYFIHTAANEYSVAVTASSEEVQSTGPIGYPRLIRFVQLEFGSDGLRTHLPTGNSPDIRREIHWVQSGVTTLIDINFLGTTQLGSDRYSGFVCDTLVDNCPADPLKLEPGSCGCGVTEPEVCECGVPEVDDDDNGVIDCLQATDSTIPDPPVIARNGKNVEVTMQDFPGTNRYRFVVRLSNGQRLRYITRSNRLTISDLPRRSRFSGYYFVETGEGFRVRSKWSDTAEFVIGRIRKRAS